MLSNFLAGDNMLIKGGAMFLITFYIVYKYRKRGGRNRV